MLNNYFLAGFSPFMPERKMWNSEEDRILKILKQEKGEKKWSVIALKMHIQYGIAGRTGKQCRERYHNHLDQTITTTSWSKEEEETLLRMHEQIGNRWPVIAQKLTGRSENCVKNHFYSKLRKSVRKLNKLIVNKFKKDYKQIKICSVYKVLEICENSFKNNSKYDEDMIECCQFKSMLIQLQKSSYTCQIFLPSLPKLRSQISKRPSRQSCNSTNSRPSQRETAKPTSLISIQLLLSKHLGTSSKWQM